MDRPRWQLLLANLFRKAGRSPAEKGRKRLLFFFTGIGIGIVVSAPVGPVNLMAIQRAFRHGFAYGLAAGLGAVLADALFATMAAFGITAIAQALAGHRLAIQAVGGLLLIGFGWMTVRTHPHLDTSGGGRTEIGTGLLPGMLAAFAMTVTNPGAVLGFVAIFGALGSLTPEPGNYVGAATLVAGVAAGALGWWAGVAAVVTLLRERMNDRWLDRINLGAGSLLLVSGVVILARGLYGLAT